MLDFHAHARSAMLPFAISPLDRLVAAADNALRTISGASIASRACPAAPDEPPPEPLDPAQHDPIKGETEPPRILDALGIPRSLLGY